MALPRLRDWLAQRSGGFRSTSKCAACSPGFRWRTLLAWRYGCLGEGKTMVATQAMSPPWGSWQFLWSAVSARVETGNVASVLVACSAEMLALDAVRYPAEGESPTVGRMAWLNIHRYSARFTLWIHVHPMDSIQLIPASASSTKGAGVPGVD